MNQAKKRMWIWIAVGVAVALAILSIFCVEYYMDNKETIGFPEDGISATLKLGGLGYTTTLQDDTAALSSLANDASVMHDVAFFGAMTSYIEVYDAETGAIQAQIFYFTHNSDAKLLYEAMKKTWQYDKDAGELRYQKNAVYMGYTEVLEQLEK